VVGASAPPAEASSHGGSLFGLATDQAQIVTSDSFAVTIWSYERGPDGLAPTTDTVNVTIARFNGLVVHQFQVTVAGRMTRQVTSQWWWGFDRLFVTAASQTNASRTATVRLFVYQSEIDRARQAELDKNDIRRIVLEADQARFQQFVANTAIIALGAFLLIGSYAHRQAREEDRESWFDKSLGRVRLGIFRDPFLRLLKPKNRAFYGTVQKRIRVSDIEKAMDYLAVRAENLLGEARRTKDRYAALAKERHRLRADLGLPPLTPPGAKTVGNAVVPTRSGLKRTRTSRDYAVSAALALGAGVAIFAAALHVLAIVAGVRIAPFDQWPIYGPLADAWIRAAFLVTLALGAAYMARGR
jgi:hypothetical protein